MTGPDVRLCEAPKDYRWRRYLAKSFGVTLTGDIPERLIELGLPAPLSRQRRDRLETIRWAGVLFIHIPKNAGTSIAATLYGRSIKHDTIRYYERVAPDFVRNAASFAVIRDPVARFLSAWRYARAGGGEDREVAVPFRARYREFRSIDDALDHVEHRRRIYDIDHIFRPQKWFITRRDGSIGVKHLVTLDEIHRLPEIFGGRAFEAMPHYNRTGEDLSELSARQTARIRELYHEDFVIWNGLRSRRPDADADALAASGTFEASTPAFR